MSIIDKFRAKMRSKTNCTRILLKLILIVVFGLASTSFFLCYARHKSLKFQKFRYMHTEDNIALIRLQEEKTQWINQSKYKSLLKTDTKREWYFKNGARYPTQSKEREALNRLLSNNQDTGDRIIEQLMYIPFGYNINSKIRTILLYEGTHNWATLKSGKINFEGCPVDKCKLTKRLTKIFDAPAVVFKDLLKVPNFPRHPWQVWIKYHTEPEKTDRTLKNFNWTATYRKDSDLVIPFRKWVYYSPEIRQKVQKPSHNRNKTKKVVSIVRNCTLVSGSFFFIRELSKHIPVDIYSYGNCGLYRCDYFDESNGCMKKFEQDYKFYLAFEDVNCRDYISDDFFIALQHNILPVVMGAHPDDYKMLAPERSYIHVDEFSGAEELATYLKLLDQDEFLYNSYFYWKGTGEFIDTYFWCRLCALLHSPRVDKSYGNFDEFWSRPDICISGNWTDHY